MKTSGYLMLSDGDVPKKERQDVGEVDGVSKGYVGECLWGDLESK